MKAPKVVLKNIKTFEGMEGVGLNADMWINGVKCLRVIDEGNGGMFLYRKVYDEKNDDVINENIKVLNEYIELLPPLKIGDSEFPMDMDLFVDQIFDVQRKTKEQKNSFLIGKPNAISYTRLNFKRPLKDIPLELLKLKYNFIQRNHMQNGDVFLNTNLKELGLV